jgi:hypothetical protein
MTLVFLWFQSRGGGAGLLPTLLCVCRVIEACEGRKYTREITARLPFRCGPAIERHRQLLRDGHIALPSHTDQNVRSQARDECIIWLPRIRIEDVESSGCRARLAGNKSKWRETAAVAEHSHGVLINGKSRNLPARQQVFKVQLLQRAQGCDNVFSVCFGFKPENNLWRGWRIRNDVWHFIN